MTRSDDIKDLAVALSKAQGEISNPEKNAENPYYSKPGKAAKYADLAEVLNVVRPVFSKNGLSFVQCPSIHETSASVETMLLHESGQWISEVISSPIPPRKDKDTGMVLPVTAQSIGSVITYLRRYSLAAFAGVAQEDDDGNAGIGIKQEQNQVDKSLPTEPPQKGKKDIEPDDFL